MLLDELEHLYGRRRGRHRHPMEKGEEEEDVAGDASSSFQPVVDSDAPRFRKAAFDESIVDAFLKQMNELNQCRGDGKEAVIDNNNNDDDDDRKGVREEIRERADDDEDDEEEELRLEEVEDAVAEFRTRLFSTTKSFVRLVFDHLSEKNGEKNDANDGGVDGDGGNDSVNTSANPDKNSPVSAVSSGKFKVNNNSNGNNPLLSSSPRGVLKLDFNHEFLENHDLKAKDDLILLVSTAERFKPGFDDYFSAHFGSLFKNSEWNS